MKPSSPSRAVVAPSPPSRLLDLVRRLAAPTTLAYEVGAIAFATVAAPLIFAAVKAMGR